MPRQTGEQKEGYSRWRMCWTSGHNFGFAKCHVSRRRRKSRQNASAGAVCFQLQAFSNNGRVTSDHCIQGTTAAWCLRQNGRDGIATAVLQYEDHSAVPLHLPNVEDCCLDRPVKIRRESMPLRIERKIAHRISGRVVLHLHLLSFPYYLMGRNDLVNDMAFQWLQGHYRKRHGGGRPC